MKQYILRKLMLIAVLLTGVNAFSHDFEVGGIYYKIISSSDKTVAVTYRGDSYNSYNNDYSGQVTIPETVTYNSMTYSVTSIGDYAFRECRGMTSVTIGNSVTSIGSSAFSYCSGLTSVTIGNSVTSIGSSAFFGCSGLTSVNISDLEAWCKIDFSSSYSNPLYSAKNLYLNGELLTNLEIPNSITKIKQYAFYNCRGLTSVTIPESVTSIGEYAFSGCSGLTSVIIPNSVTSIGNYAFSGCSGLTSVIIGNSVTSIGHYAFSGCSGLTSVIIGNSVTSIGYSAFYNCSGLTSVTIPNSVTSIGERAFYYCSALTSVTIGNSVTSIGDDAFYGCSGLKRITISDLEAWCKIDFSDYDSNPLYYAKNLYLNGELLTNIEIPNPITEIKKYAFYNCSGLTCVAIGNSVTSIGNYAFSYCSGLTSITIGNGVTSIGNNAFSYCSGLTEIICKSSTPPAAYYNTFYIVPFTAMLYVPVGSKQAYASAQGWNYFTYIEEKEFSGVESTIADEVNVAVENGNIIVNGAEDANIEVYSTNGQCVYNGTDTGIAVNTKGLYIVKVNGKSFKVIL